MCIYTVFSLSFYLSYPHNHNPPATATTTAATATTTHLPPPPLRSQFRSIPTKKKTVAAQKSSRNKKFEWGSCEVCCFDGDLFFRQEISYFSDLISNRSVTDINVVRIERNGNQIVVEHDLLVRVSSGYSEIKPRVEFIR
ncbi:hypothetical protein Hanom_Chr11g01041931 [Helianthus anomalus]